MYINELGQEFKEGDDCVIITRCTGSEQINQAQFVRVSDAGNVIVERMSEHSRDDNTTYYAMRKSRLQFNKIYKPNTPICDLI